ncbi:MAG: alpha/beta hydrolase-fold protein [Bradymonadia bacterium]
MWVCAVLGACTSESTGDASPTGEGGPRRFDASMAPLQPDGAIAEADAAPPSTEQDAEAPLADGGLNDARPDDMPGEDAQVLDATVLDATVLDATGPVSDGGIADSNMPDSEMPDSEMPDSTPPDAGPAPQPCALVDDPHPELQWIDDGRRLIIDPFPGIDALRDRRVIVYLPASYDADPARRFPVMYMHDGQNLFDPREAFGGQAWEADDTFDRLTAEGVIEPVIVVAVDNTVDRIWDYTPTVDPGEGIGGGLPVYGRWLTEQLKPFIDARLRTVCDPEHTGIGGSSLGGLASLWLLDNHQDHFGRALCMSSSLWWNDTAALDEMPALAATWRPGNRLWLDAGNLENGGFDGDGNGLVSVVEHSRQARDLLIAGGLTFGDDLAYLETPLDPHNEGAWRRRLPDALTYMWAPDTEDAPPAELSLRVYGDAVAGGVAVATAVDATLPSGARVTLPASALTFEVDDPEIATVTPGGEVSGLAGGETTLRVRLRAAPEVGTEGRIQVGGDGTVQVTFDITVPPNTPPGDTIYLNGDAVALGTWQAEAAVPMQPAGDRRWTLTLDLPPGPIEFKAHRGNWGTVEKGAFGEEIGNRQAEAAEGVTIEGTVLNWADIR